MRRIMYSRRVGASLRHKNSDTGLRSARKIKIGQDVLDSKLHRLEGFGAGAKPIGIASEVRSFGRVGVYDQRIIAAVLSPSPGVYCLDPHTVDAGKLDRLAGPQHKMVVKSRNPN